MKKSIAMIFAATALLISAGAAWADQVSKTAKIEEILSITHSDRMMSQMLDQMKNSLNAQVSKMDIPEGARASTAEMQQKILDLVAERLSWDKARPKFVQVYDETFSESEIDGILAFYKSPAGQSMLEKMPQLMQRSMAVGQQLMGDITPDIKRMMQEMQDKVKKQQPQ